MSYQKRAACLSILFLFFLLTSGYLTPATAIKSGRKISRSQQKKQGLISTGLRPIYPAGAKCEKISSFFGDRTRYDGSMRTIRSNHGYHGGMDISLPIGTPIIAIADGTVINKARLGMLVGIKIMIKHSPEDTGLRVWTYSKYQHFNEFPDLEVGQRVKMGQVIGYSGRTGTVGGHYGSEGYPHLHMNIYSSKTNKYTEKTNSSLIKIEDAKYVDPLAVYFGQELDSHAIKTLPKKSRKFPIPFKTTDGNVIPPETKVVWPILCAPR